MEVLFQEWLKNATEDPDLIPELESVRNDPAEISSRFYADLEFGTAGLRGVIGAGINRMNIYTVGKATQGLAQHVKNVDASASVAISYDSRIKSGLFAKTAASVLAANGVKVYIYKEIMPVPMLSFAVRYLKCQAGIMITASHNPAKYNGYKAYGPDGCQLNIEDSAKVFSYIQKVDTFTGIQKTDFDAALAEGKISYIGDDVIDAYISNVKKQSVAPDACANNDFSVIYTPLHGAGNMPVQRILKEIGVENVTVVPSQEKPDGHFPTVPFPNPEFREAFNEALELAKIKPADLLLATDPDCDRVGIAVKKQDDYVLFTGNEVGVMLLHYLLSVKQQKGALPKDPVAIKTIVTTEQCVPICEKYGCQLKNVLTGFRFIGEQILLLEEKNQEDRYIFGFEESYGYLAGSYVRDKDAVVASMLICEMACYYKKQGKSLIDVYDEINQEFGLYLNKQKSFTCEGQEGMQKIAGIMEKLRKNPPEQIAGVNVVAMADYKHSVAVDTITKTSAKIDLPSSDVLEYSLACGAKVIVRPSGTEPKIKIYLSVRGTDKISAEKNMDTLTQAATELLGF